MRTRTARAPKGIGIKALELLRRAHEAPQHFSEGWQSASENRMLDLLRVRGLVRYEPTRCGFIPTEEGRSLLVELGWMK